MNKCSCGRFLPNNRKICDRCIKKAVLLHSLLKKLGSINYLTSEKTIEKILKHSLKILKTKI